MTASEVVLGTAIIMGLSALVTVVLRICTSRRRSSRTVTDTPGDFDRMGALRISLSSLQQRVMSKLRDRPPRYETRHNYEYQRRKTSTRIPVLNPAAVLAAVNEPSIPPPAYETNSDDNSVRESSVEVSEVAESCVILGERVAANLPNRHRRQRWLSQ